MIKASELRIGNLVKFSEDGAVFEIETIDRSGFDVSGNGEVTWIEADQFEAISLTEDHLLKFGLIKKYLENQFEDGGFELKEDKTRWYSWVRGLFNLEIQPDGEIWIEVYSHYVHVKHVHQLQNIYFALTGEELELRDEVLGGAEALI